MQNVQLFVNDLSVDIDPSIEVALTFQVNDFAEIKDRQASYTNQFKVLFTANSHAIFEHANKVQSAGRTKYNRINARLVVDGTQYKGFIVLDATVDSYSIVFYSGNAEFFKLIDGLKLIDLDFTSFDQLWNYTNMIAAYGDPTSPTFLIVDDGNIAATGRTIDIREQYFSMYVQTVFEKIITEQGFTFSGSLFDDYKYLKAFLPFTNEKPLVNLLTIAESTSMQSGGGPGSSDYPYNFDATYDPNNDWTIVGIETAFYASVNMRVRVHGTLIVSLPVALAGTVTLKVMVGRVSLATYTYETIIVLTTGVITSNVSYDYDFNIDLLAGDFIQIVADSTINAYVDLEIGSTINIETTAPVEALFDHNIWEPEMNLPDMTQTDFVKAVMQMTACVIDTDGINKVLRFELFNSIVENKINAPNIDQYIDHSIPATQEHHPTTYAQKNWLRYKSDEVVLPKYYGDANFLIDDNTIETEKTLFTLPFAASVEVTKLHDIPMWEVLRVASSSPEPRILLKGDLLVTGTPYGSITLTDGTTSGGQGTFSYGYFYEALQTHNLDFDSLLAEYYQPIVIMLNNYCKLKTEIFLSQTFINQLDLLQPLFSQFYNSYFYLNKIENHKLSKASLMSLIKL